MKSPYDVILRPVLTEKSYDMMSLRKYTFYVDPRCNKTEIRQAAETIFGIQVASVTTQNLMGKMKRQGLHQGRRPARKKAVITLKPESKGIDFFEGMAQE